MKTSLFQSLFAKLAPAVVRKALSRVRSWTVSPHPHAFTVITAQIMTETSDIRNSASAIVSLLHPYRSATCFGTASPRL
jgi:hypothetical protein